MRVDLRPFAVARHHVIMTKPDAPEEPIDPRPAGETPTVEALLEENERLRVELALHRYFNASEAFKKKVPTKKRKPSKR
jgi:hypothetical protein